MKNELKNYNVFHKCCNKVDPCLKGFMCVIKPLFVFLEIPQMFKEHWSNFVDWGMF
jgi:hypothetical protein